MITNNTSAETHPDLLLTRTVPLSPSSNRLNRWMPLWWALWACAKKDLSCALREPLFVIQCTTLALNYLITISLFVLMGSNAPTAVILLDHGPYAHQFYEALQQAHSFRLTTMAQGQGAYRDLSNGQFVAVVTIPADFDARLGQGQPVQLGLVINNLHTDMTDDVRRGMHLATTLFYAHAFPGVALVTAQETDAYPQDTDYIPYLALAIMVVCTMVSGVLLAGTSLAKEWEQGTMKALYLAPVPTEAWLLGKLLAACLLGLVPMTAVLAVIVGIVGDHPVHWPLVVGVSLLILVVFAALGLLLGSLLQQRSVVATLARGVTVPLIFLSGVFVPLSFLPMVQQILARCLPVHYAVVLEQYAFKGFETNTLPMTTNALVLFAFGVLFLIGAWFDAQRRQTSF